MVRTKTQPRHVALTSTPRRVAFTSAPVPNPSPILKSKPLPSQKTWENMITRLETKYSKKEKKKKKKRRSSSKKRKQSKAQKKAYQAKLRSMVKKPVRPRKAVKKAVKLQMSLLDVMKRFPAAKTKRSINPNVSSLCSLVCGSQGAKRKLKTFV